MNDRLQAVQHFHGGDKPLFGSLDKGVMRSVVKNVVVNMESVLNDLQGIMGEITTIVEQIDTVTGKMDKNCKLQKENRSHILPNNEFQRGSSSKWTVDTLNFGFNTRIDTDKLRLCEMPNCNLNQHVAKGNDLSRSHKPHQSTLKLAKVEPQTTEVICSNDWQHDTKMSYYQKSFSHFPKDGSRPIPQSGAIAVVYPTIINNSPFQAGNQEIATTYSKRLENCEESASLGRIIDSILLKSSNNSDFTTRGQQATSQEEQHMKNKQNETKQEASTTNVYLKSEATVDGKIPTVVKSNDENYPFKLPTVQTKVNSSVIDNSGTSKLPTVQTKVNSSVIDNSGTSKLPTVQAKVNNSVIDNIGNSKLPTVQSEVNSSVTENIGNSKLKKSAVLNVKLTTEPTNSNLVSETSAQFQTPLSKYSKIQFSDVLLQMDHSHISPEKDLISNSSPFKNSSKSGSSKVQMSPTSMVPNDPVCQFELSSFNSVDSELNAYSNNDNHDTSCATPVIDWSYLNLIGNKQVHDNAPTILCPNDRYQLYQIPVAHFQKTISPIEPRPYNDVRLPVLNSRSLIRSEPSFSEIFTPLTNVHTIYDSPVWTHTYCNEVTSGESDAYCGFYETIMDSLLESIPGFESFEQACEEMDNPAILSREELSFDDEYEDDDWDIELNSDDQDSYELSSVGSQNVYGHDDSNLRRSETIDINRNVLAANSTNLQKPEIELSVRSKDNLIPGRTYYGRSNTVKETRGKQEMYTMNAGLKVSVTSRKSFTVNHEDVRQRVSMKYQPFNFVSKSKLYNGRERDKNANETELEIETSISDTTSSILPGSESPMSFSSLDTSFVSSETGRPDSKSAGEDWLLSTDDTSSTCSETRHKTSASIHKAKMRKLRRDFFKSLYTSDDNRERYREQDREHRHDLSICLKNRSGGKDMNRDNISESGSLQETITSSYNRDINTWTAYALVHMQSGDMSDSVSDIFSDSTVSSSSMTAFQVADDTSILDANI